MVSCAIFSSFSALKIKHRQQPLEGILPVETGIREPALFGFPFGQSPVVKSLFAVLDEEGNNVEPQALLQRDQPPDPAVAVLEGVDLLKFRVEGDDVLYPFFKPILQSALPYSKSQRSDLSIPLK